MRYEVEQEVCVHGGGVGRIIRCYDDGTYKVFISGADSLVIYTEEQLDGFKQIARRRASEILRLWDRDGKSST